MSSDADRKGDECLAFRKEVAMVMSDINTRRDPKAYREEQLPRLRRLLEKFKKKTDG